MNEQKSKISKSIEFEPLFKIVENRQAESVNDTIISESLSIPNKISDDREDIQNQGLKQDISLKKQSLQMLFWFLGIETFVIFSFTFFQAIKKPFDFQLEEWSFKLVIAATITQITYMLQVAIKHLFPQK